jgi:hypothetical protein
LDGKVFVGSYVNIFYDRLYVKKQATESAEQSIKITMKNIIITQKLY